MRLYKLRTKEGAHTSKLIQTRKTSVRAHIRDPYFEPVKTECGVIRSALQLCRFGLRKKSWLALLKLNPKDSAPEGQPPVSR